MASTNKTTNYDLSQFQSSDIPAWLTDYNGDMQKIDAGIRAAKVQADGAASGVSALQTAVSGKQDTLNFDNAPIAGSANPVTSGGIYNALQNVSVQTDAVPTEGSAKAVQSGGVYAALLGKQDKMTVVWGRFENNGPEYYYNNTTGLIIIVNSGSYNMQAANWNNAAGFPSLQKGPSISGNPFNLPSNSTYPSDQSGILALNDISLGARETTTVGSGTVFFKLAYIADENKTYIIYRCNYPDTSNNHSIGMNLIGNCRGSY